MEFYLNCKTGRKNTGIQDLCDDISAIQSFILMPGGFTADVEDIRDVDFWNSLVHETPSKRAYPFPQIFSMTDNSEDTVFEEGALGNLFVRDGKIQLQFMIGSSRYKHEAMKSHSRGKYDVILIDKDGRGQAIRTQDGKVAGMPLQQFVVERLQMNDGTGAATKTLVTMIFADAEGWQKSPYVITGSDWLKSLTGLIDIDLSVTNPTIAGFTLTAKVHKAGDPFNADIDELVVKNSSGVVQTITSVTVENGVHTVNATLTAGTYTVNLKAPADMKTKGYESTGAVEFTVS